MKLLTYTLLAMAVLSADTTGQEPVKEGQLGTSFVAQIAIPTGGPNVQQRYDQLSI